LRVLYIFFLFGQFDFFLPPGFSDIHPKDGEDGLKVFFGLAQISEHRLGVSRILIETPLGDLCRIFTRCEIDDGLPGLAPCDPSSCRHGSISCFAA
jgi:hypothetical protein